MSGALDTCLADHTNLLKEADRLFGQVANSHQNLVKCVPGCDDCCQAVFLCSAVEGLTAAAALRGLLRSQRRQVRRRAHKALRQWELLVTGLEHGDADAANRVMARSRIECPVLEDNRCLVYELRPVTCRLYGVPTSVGHESRTCGRSGFEPGGVYPTVRLDGFEARLDRVSRRMLDIMGAQGVPVRAPLAAYLSVDGPGIDSLMMAR